MPNLHRYFAGQTVVIRHYAWRDAIAWVLSVPVLISWTFAASNAYAVDGCKVLLCLAAPNWKAIPDCVPTIIQLHRDLAHGKPFPPCPMAGAGNSANNTWASAPSNCPPQYTHIGELQSGSTYACDYSGVVTVTINGVPFTRTWWSMGGGSVTEYSSAAKSQLGSWDTKFDDDYAFWVASQPQQVSTCPSC